MIIDEGEFDPASTKWAAFGTAASSARSTPPETTPRAARCGTESETTRANRLPLIREVFRFLALDDPDGTVRDVPSDRPDVLAWPPDQALVDVGDGPLMPGLYLGPDTAASNELVWEEECVETFAGAVGDESPADRAARLRAGRLAAADGTATGPARERTCYMRPRLFTEADPSGTAGREIDYLNNYGAVSLESLRYASELGIDPTLPTGDALHEVIPQTLVEMERELGYDEISARWKSQNTGTDGIVFRQFECPVPLDPGTYGTVRPVICQDGKARSAFYLPDHMTPCSAGDPGCARRVFVEPVVTSGGLGTGQFAPSGVDDYHHADVARFGDTFRHLCTVDGAGYITDIADGRVGVDGTGVYHWEENPAWNPRTPTGVQQTRGRWVSGAGAGDGLAHGHDPTGGWAPRTGWVEAQDGNYWFEPFLQVDNLVVDRTRAQAAGSVPESVRRAVLESSGDYDGRGDILLRGDNPAGCNPATGESCTECNPVTGEGCMFFQGDMRERDPVSRISYEETRSTPYQVASRSTTFRVWPEIAGEDLFRNVRLPAWGYNRPEGDRRTHLVYGWPVLDLQDQEADVAYRLYWLANSRIRTQQRLVGVPPEQRHAEQVWVRHDGPLQLYGAVRVGNGAGDSGKGGCLLEVNPPGAHFADQANRPFRRVLDGRQQAWCVIPVTSADVKPTNSCITLMSAGGGGPGPDPDPDPPVPGCEYGPPVIDRCDGTTAVYRRAVTAGGAECAPRESRVPGHPACRVDPPASAGRCWECLGGDSDWVDHGACDLAAADACWRGTCLASAPTAPCGDAAPE